MYDKQIGERVGLESRYVIKAKIKFIEEKVITHKKVDSKYQHERLEEGIAKSVILIPEHNTELTKFILAHNPDNLQMAEPIEFVAIISLPIGKPARLSYRTLDEKFREPHYFTINTMDVEDLFTKSISIKEDDTLTFEVLPYSEEQNYNV